MKIIKLKSEKLRNNQHFQFHTEFNELLVRFVPQTLGVEEAYAVYQPLLNNEAQAVDVIQKSPLTVDVADADHSRDQINSGFCETVSGACKHFDPLKKEAAKHILVVLDHFGNIGEKPYEEQSAATSNLIRDLETNYADDLATLELQGWLAALKSSNNRFIELSKERYTSNAGKTQLKMKEVRKNIEVAYRNITDRIDALALINGSETYAPFIKELNKRIQKYNNKLAQRKGRNKKEKVK